MIGKLSKKLLSILYRHKLIDNDNIELLEYGLFLFFSYILYAVICLACGAVFHSLIQSVIFYLTFCVVRVFAGGFHASTETRCFIISALSIIISVYSIKQFTVQNLNLCFVILLLISSIIIFIFAPVDTDNKKLDSEERKRFRKISRIILICFLLIIAVMFFKHSWISFAMGMAVNLEGFMLFTERIRRFFKNSAFTSRPV